ncbi:glycosyltransferase family 2 protein [Polymorphobacter sp. PAMC 29334]|uniref:glycosyltransferase family 2 protein n=1 Tax=Polymorphobacter sp. PAMC 29334 TaxID=2862331 RepID=UPI001C66843E|nr:glycosyltransferase family A protein [Polymorphobacter sp. PAMC 29334]QYE35053.1 glycosyltransferase family 2 protein [Polymorphobacter sp. PAMC 29334]
MSFAPAVSLIVSTLGDGADLARLFDSLDAQTFRDFDVVIVDQNAHDGAAAAIAAIPRSFPVNRIPTPGMRGLSIGRNVGWRAAHGRILLFPDDNCWYPKDFLERGVAIMAARDAAILTGRSADEDGKTILGAFDDDAVLISRASVWTTSIEWVTFVRRDVLEAIGGYDAAIGVGAATPWQACEGQDFLLRAMAAGFACWYDPAVYGHDVTWAERTTPGQMRRKARAYGRGMGYVLALHRFGLAQKARWVGRSALGALVYAARLDREKVGYYLQTMLGRIEGIRGYAKSKPH